MGLGYLLVPAFVSLFKQTIYNRWQTSHDSLVGTLSGFSVTQCDPPLKRPSYTSVCAQWHDGQYLRVAISSL